MPTEHTRYTQQYNDVVWLKSHLAFNYVRMLRWFSFFPFIHSIQSFIQPFGLSFNSIRFLFYHLCHTSTWWFGCWITFTIVNCEALLAVCFSVFEFHFKWDKRKLFIFEILVNTCFWNILQRATFGEVLCGEFNCFHYLVVTVQQMKKKSKNLLWSIFKHIQVI